MVGEGGILGDLWREGYCADRQDEGSVPAGTEVAEGNDQVRRSVFELIRWMDADVDVSTMACRDGDTVKIRASEDGKTLEIEDNHVPDPSIAASATPIGRPTFEDGETAESSASS